MLLALPYLLTDISMNHYINLCMKASGRNSIATKKLRSPHYFTDCIKISQSLYSYNIIFCWLPSHADIPGNEKAGKAAKSALNKPILRIHIPYTDLRPIVNKYIYDKWQQTWNSQTQNKLNLSKYTFLLHSLIFTSPNRAFGSIWAVGFPLCQCFH